MSLQAYKKKRNFTKGAHPDKKTPEPGASVPKKKNQKLRFVVQRHEATRLHYDFRLEMEGVLKSWAVPKGPSLNPNDKRLAVEVEDHPFEYRKFKGYIPEGNYGAGRVQIWDEGTYEPLNKSNGKKSEALLLQELKKGDLKFILSGTKLRGAFALVRMSDGKNWLLIKKKDEFAISKNYDIEKVHPLKPVPERKTEAKKKKASPVKKNNDRVSSSSNDTPLSSVEGQLTQPMLAKLADAPFDDPQWLFEYKWDGYRTVAVIENSGVKLISRNGLSLTEQFATVAKDLKKIKESAIIDGEIAILDEKGRPSFQLLQNYKRTKKGTLTYYIFDLLYLNGETLLHLELLHRKELLEFLFRKYKFSNLSFSDHVRKEGKELFEKAKKKEYEGIIAKKSDSSYEPGRRSSSWLKIKTSQGQEAIIAGYTEPRGSRKKFGALILGIHRNGKLSYAGHCGTGFNEDSLKEVYLKLQPLIADECPFETEPKTNTPVTWLKPKLICEVQFSEWTSEGIMRIPVFKGLRSDKSPKEVSMEIPVKTKKARSKSTPAKSSDSKKNTEIIISGHPLKLTNLSKLYWHKEKYTKGDLVEYYKSIAKIMLPYLKDRPQSMHRHPNGIEQPGFYQKDVEPAQLSSWLQTVQIHSESGNKYIDYLLCQNEAALVYMANLGCIEINPWNSRKDTPDQPDYIVIDLDPGEIGFKQVVKTALVTKDVFDEMGVKSYCKTSGATGLHIYVPLGAKYNYEQARTFAQIVANAVHNRLPKITSIERNPAKRKKLIYVDFLQNSRGQTLAAPYSVRPRPGATVSTPLHWDEVNSELNPKKFTMFNIPERVSQAGDLWKPVLGKGINMEKALQSAES